MVTVLPAALADEPEMRVATGFYFRSMKVMFGPSDF